MNYFFYILLDNVIPLVIMIGAGMLLYRLFKIDNKTLTKLIFYFFSPVIIFKMIYHSELTGALLLRVLLFLCLFILLLLIVTETVCRLRGYTGSMKNAMRNSVIFYNSGNYALPLNQLVFAGSATATAVQIVIWMVQNLAANTFGVYSVNSGKGNVRQIFRTMFSMPSIYSIPLAFLMKGFHVPIPKPIDIPIEYIAGGFIPVALLTLGVQLGSMTWKIRISDVVISNVLRLSVAPLLGFLVVRWIGIEGIIAQTLVLSCAVPTSVQSMLLAVEFDNEPDFSSQVVFSSTIFSIITVAVVISLLKFV